MSHRLSTSALLAGLLAAALPPAGAQTPPADAPAPTTAPAAAPPATNDDVRQQLADFQARLAALEAKHAEEAAAQQKHIAELEARVAELQAATSRSAAGGTPSTQPGGAEDELTALLAESAPQGNSPAQPTGLAGAMQGAVQSFNPDISLNANFLGSYRNHEGGKPTSKFELSELEIGFSGNVDPYTRAVAIATVSRDGSDYKADLEEGYLTFLQMPYGLQARVGEFRAEFGRTNPTHLHAVPWTDYPLVIQRYFGEEGLSGAGAELSWLVPNPWNQYITAVYEIMNNDNATIFAGDQADDVTHLLRLKTFSDLGSGSTLEAGASVATGPNDHGHGSHRSTVEGFDITYRWKPPNAGLYNAFLWQTEVLAAQADIRGGEESTWGAYTAGEYQFARQWKIGLRYDDTELPFSSSMQEQEYSAYLTFLQSEFVMFRLAYQVIDRNFSDNHVRDEQRVMLQVNWTMGTHPAHSY